MADIVPAEVGEEGGEVRAVENSNITEVLHLFFEFVDLGQQSLEQSIALHLQLLVADIE